MTFDNPVIPGFFPDPSVCRVGGDFYLVCSSFSLFPGIPLFHSTDLVLWELWGQVLDRPSQLHVTPDALVGGIMAPTLRYHRGTFYVIGTNVSSRGNFVVTATDPRGPWSEPLWLPEAPGIDPSLFFDGEDAYLTGTRRDGPMPGVPGGQTIWGSRIDLATGRLVGEAPSLWRGALTGASSPEAPHLYHKEGWYYLLIAEGGTEHFHAVTVARSRHPLGPYEGFAGNPVLTHRHLGKNYPIGNPGHADLVELPDGSWYAVLLASRLIGGYHKNLGRETFLVPVTWEDGWPVFSPGTGKVEARYPLPDLPASQLVPVSDRDEFDAPALGGAWVSVGTPYQPLWSLAGGDLVVRLSPRPLAPDLKAIDVSRPPEVDTRKPGLAFVGRRQVDVAFAVTTALAFTALADGEAAGLAVLQASNHQFRLERGQSAGRPVLRLVQVTCAFNVPPHVPGFVSRTTEAVLAQTEVRGPQVLRIEARGQDFRFWFGPDEQALSLLAQADGRIINPEIVGGMVGTLVGMYATANGQASENSARFGWFEYRALS